MEKGGLEDPTGGIWAKVTSRIRREGLWAQLRRGLGGSDGSSLVAISRERDFDDPTGVFRRNGHMGLRGSDEGIWAKGISRIREGSLGEIDKGTSRIRTGGLWVQEFIRERDIKGL